jgi:hypothetical protein
MAVITRDHAESIGVTMKSMKEEDDKSRRDHAHGNQNLSIAKTMSDGIPPPGLVRTPSTGHVEDFEFVD